MGSAALLVTSHQRPVVRLDEQDAALPIALLYVLQAPLEFPSEVPPTPDVHDHDHPVGSPVPLRSGIHYRGDHARRQVVYTEVAGVLEGLQRVGLARS